ncbi:MAG TPA: hypothetical protein VH599_10370 [Ktedonobacterales bacterium]|jgi:hypothetical protein
MQKVTATESQGFTVTEPPKIIIRNPVGAVDVIAGEVDQVTVQATKKARNSSYEAAERDLEEITVSMEQNGNTVTVQVDLGQAFPSWSQRSVRLLVTVPERADLDADVKVGKLHIYGLTGKVLAQVATGQAELRRVTLADESRLLAHTGQVDLDGALVAGASLDVRVHVGSADLRLPAATYAHLDASTHIGQIDVSGWPVSVWRRNLGARASGDMSTEPTGALNVQADVGSVSLAASS